MECKHEWKSVPAVGNSHGHFRDECVNCGCVGEPDWNNPVNGFIPIKARPLAKIVDFSKFKQEREIEKAALKALNDFGSYDGGSNG